MIVKSGVLLVLILALVLPGGYASSADQGKQVEWPDIAVPQLSGNIGRPPVVVAACGSKEKLAIWMWPDRVLALPRLATRSVAWDVAGRGQVVALLTAAGRTQTMPDQPPSYRTTVDKSGYRSLVVLVDWQGHGKVLASLPGNPVAVAWIAKLGCAAVAVQAGEILEGSAKPSDSRQERVPSDLYLVGPGREPHKFGWSTKGLIQIADADDGRHVFTLERLKRKATGAFGPTTEDVDGLAVRDFQSGDRKALVMPVFDGWIFGHKGFAYVTTPPPSWDLDKTGKQTYRVETPNSGVLKVGVDGSTSIALEVDPPDAVWSLAVGASGLVATVHGVHESKESAPGRVYRVDWDGNRTLIAKFSEGLTFDGDPGQRSIWVAMGEEVPGASGLVAVDREQPKEPTVYLVQHAGARELGQPAGTEATAGDVAVGTSVALQVRRAGQVRATFLGRRPVKDVRPWMICAVEGDRLSRAEGWGPGRPIDCAVAYPMRVGQRTYLYIAGKTYEMGSTTAPSGGGGGGEAVATIPSWGAGEMAEREEGISLVFQPEGDVPLVGQ